MYPLCRYLTCYRELCLLSLNSNPWTYFKLHSALILPLSVNLILLVQDTRTQRSLLHCKLYISVSVQNPNSKLKSLRKEGVKTSIGIKRSPFSRINLLCFFFSFQQISWTFAEPSLTLISCMPVKQAACGACQVLMLASEITWPSFFTVVVASEHLAT